MLAAAHKILIADDSPEVREALAGLLGSEDREIHFATTGLECLARAAETHPDLILPDIMMPEKERMLVSQPAKLDSSGARDVSVPAPIPLILVGAPPEFGDSWRAVIRAKPPFEFAGAAATHAQGLELLAALPPCRRVVVVDFSLSMSEATAMLKGLRDQWPQARRLALVSTGVQQMAARAAGAEAVLFRGFDVAELNSVLDDFAS